MCNATVNGADSNPSPFSIILPGVGVNDKHASKNLFRIREVEAVLPDVRAVLGFVPFKIQL
jgi:hypothetical protein